MKTYILISESLVGIHKPDPSWEEDIRSYALVFPPKASPDSPLQDLRGNSTFRQIVKEAKKLKAAGKFGGFLVGYDLDFSGEVMAASMKDSLMKESFEEKEIIRCPLTQDGYIFLKGWPDISPLIEYSNLEKRFIALQKEAGLSPVGLEKALSLKALINFGGRSISINAPDTNPENGTSLATVLHKVMGGEG
jgi:hypothetical protein